MGSRGPAAGPAVAWSCTNRRKPVTWPAAVRPNGATECSHGCSGTAAKPPDAEPVENVSHIIGRPGGAEEMLTDTMTQSNTYRSSNSTSCAPSDAAATRRASAETESNSVAPAGREDNRGTFFPRVPLGLPRLGFARSRVRPSLHPWLQPPAPSGPKPARFVIFDELP